LPQELGIAGHRDQPGLVDDRALGIAALRAGRSGHGHYLPAQPSPVDSVAERDHHPGHTVPRHVRRGHAEHLAPPAANLTVKEQHVGRRHLDHDLPRPGDRRGRLTNRSEITRTGWLICRTPHLRCP
jgi:hypothetical protein